MQLTHHGADHPPLVLAVLAILGPLPRARVAEVLWPGSANARVNLRVAVHRVQKGPYAEALTVDDDLLSLSPETTVDLLEAERLASEGELAAAIAAAEGVLMPWLEPSHVGADTWLAGQRRRWLETYVDILRRAAAEAEASGELPLARAWTAAWVGLEPHAEVAHRAGLRLAVIAGDRPVARHLWSECEAMTASVYGRPPAPSTRAWIAALEPARSARQQMPRWPVTGRGALLAELGRSRPTLVTTSPGLGGTTVLLELAKAREHHLYVEGRAAVGPLVCLGVALRRSAGTSRTVRQALTALAAGDTGEKARALFVAAVLETIGRGGALLLDDMHLFDQASLDVVAGVLRTVERASDGQQPAIVGTAFRQETEHEPLAGWLRLAQGTHRMRIEQLAPLTRTDVAALLTHVLGGPPSAEALAALWGVTAGFPGLVDLTLRSWAAAGALLPDDAGGWNLDVARARSLPLAEAAVDLLRSRVDVLDRRNRRVLEVSLCLAEADPSGTPDSELVMAITGESRWDVVEALESLERSGFTRDGVSVLGPFAAPLLAAVPRETYRAIHRAAAEALSDSGLADDRVARHLSLAGDAAKAARTWLDHSRQCRRRARWSEALETSARALALGLPREEELACRLERFDLLTSTGDPEGARAELVAARTATATPAERVPLVVREARAHVADGAYDLALSTLDDLLEEAPEGSHAPEAHLLRGMALARLGHPDEARVALGRSREQHSPDDTLRNQEAARALVEVEMAASRFQEAADLIPDLVRLTAIVGYPYLSAITEGTLARFHAMQGQFDAALDHAARWISIAREHGFRGLESLALVLHASISLDKGDYAGSLASFLNALADVSPDHQAVVQANIGTCYLHLGQIARAFVHYEAALTDAETRNTPPKAHRRRLVICEARLRQGVAVPAVDFAGLRDADDALGSPFRTWLAQLEVQAAALRGDVTAGDVAALESLGCPADEEERRDHALALAALANGDGARALVLAQRQPSSPRMVAIQELLTGSTADADGTAGSATEQLVLAHIRGLNGTGQAADEAERRLAELEEAWPQHGGALRQLLGFYTRAAKRCRG